MCTAITRAAALGIAGILFAPMSAMAQPNGETDVQSAAAAELVSVADLSSEAVPEDASESVDDDAVVVPGGEESGDGEASDASDAEAGKDESAVDPKADEDASDPYDEKIADDGGQVVVDGSRVRFILRTGSDAAKKAAKAVHKAREEHDPLSLEAFSELVLVDEDGVAQAFFGSGEKAPLPEGLRTVTFITSCGAFNVDVAFPAKSWSTLQQVHIDGKRTDFYINMNKIALDRILAAVSGKATISYDELADLLDWLQARAGMVHEDGAGVDFYEVLFVPGVHEVSFGVVSVMVDVPQGTDYSDRDGQLPDINDVTPGPDDSDSDQSDDQNSDQSGDRDDKGSRGGSDDSNVAPAPNGGSASGGSSAPEDGQGASAQGSVSPAGSAGAVRIVGLAESEQQQSAAEKSEAAKDAATAGEEPTPEASKTSGPICLPTTCVKGDKQNLASHGGVTRQGVDPVGVAMALFGGFGLGLVIMKRKEIDAKVDRVGTAANTDCVIMKRSADWRFPRG